MKLSSYRHVVVKIGMFVGWLVVFALVLLLARINWFERNSITIFTLSGVFDSVSVQEFEKKTGIKVYINYCNSNEELLVKLRSRRESEYDLVVLSDYIIHKVLNKGLLKKIDKKKLSFLQDINPLLLGHAFDPYNDYVIPFEWELYVLGIAHDKNHNFISEENSWDAIFKPALFGSGYRLIMVNDPVEAIAMAAHYLYGRVINLDNEQRRQVELLLKSQRPWIEAYSNVRTDYYLGTGNSSVGLAQSAEIWRAVRDYKGIDFIVPQETFITIEHCALTATTKKDDLVYQFLNFFYDKEIMKRHFDVFYYCPVRLDVIDMLTVSERQKNIMKSSSQLFEKYLFIKDILTEQQMHDIWVAIKS